jgi:hypothetical protein
MTAFWNTEKCSLVEADVSEARNASIIREINKIGWRYRNRLHKVESSREKGSKHEISGSYSGEYKNDNLLGYCSAQTRRSKPSFQRCVLPLSFGRWCSTYLLNVDLLLRDYTVQYSRTLSFARAFRCCYRQITMSDFSLSWRWKFGLWVF